MTLGPRVFLNNGELRAHTRYERGPCFGLGFHTMRDIQVKRNLEYPVVPMEKTYQNQTGAHTSDQGGGQHDFEVNLDLQEGQHDGPILPMLSIFGYRAIHCGTFGSPGISDVYDAMAIFATLL